MTSMYALPATPAVVAPRPTARDVLEAVALALHAPDERWAWAHGLTVQRVGTVRVYRHPAFSARGGVK